MSTETGKNAREGSIKGKDGEWYCRFEVVVERPLSKHGVETRHVIEGPFSEKELKGRYVGREIEADTEVWSAAAGEWRRLSVQPFFSELPQLPVSGIRWSTEDLFDSRRTRRELLLGSYALWLALVAAAIYLLDWQRTMDWAQLLFLVYLAGFIGMWFVYFMSRQGPQLFRVLTLRRLLRTTTANWNVASDVRKSEMEKAFQEKARASMTATTMLAATAGLALGQVNSIINTLDDFSTLQTSGDLWQISMLGVAALFAFSALICFIIAVDTLDSLFNRFESRRVAHQLYFHFYSASINPRYFGLISLFTAAIFVVASNDALLGCAAIGLLVTIGVRHWFPRIRLPDDPQLGESRLSDAEAEERRRLWRLFCEVGGFLLRLFALAGIPLLLQLLRISQRL